MLVSVINYGAGVSVSLTSFECIPQEFRRITCTGWWNEKGEALDLCYQKWILNFEAIKHRQRSHAEAWLECEWNIFNLVSSFAISPFFVAFFTASEKKLFLYSPPGDNHDFLFLSKNSSTALWFFLLTWRIGRKRRFLQVTHGIGN